MKKEQQIHSLKLIMESIENANWDLESIDFEQGIVEGDNWDKLTTEFKPSGEIKITLNIKDRQKELEAKKFLSTAGLI